MHIDAPLLEGLHNKSAPPKFSSDVICIHCFHSLGASRSASQRARMMAKHVCAEKLLAAQPGAPPPYN